MSLSDIIMERIQKEGPISFRDFMEMALYYPKLGYYTSSRIRLVPMVIFIPALIFQLPLEQCLAAKLKKCGRI